MKKENKKAEVGYWRGFRELYNDPEFKKAKENEFAGEISDSGGLHGLTGISRRKFLALFAASAAFAAAGCSDYRDKGAIVPYNKKPEEITPGVPNWYASTCTLCPNTCGILIKTREGRPIKVDGNPDHPISKGKICAKGQAGILNLYLLTLTCSLAACNHLRTFIIYCQCSFSNPKEKTKILLM